MLRNQHRKCNKSRPLTFITLTFLLSFTTVQVQSATSKIPTQFQIKVKVQKTNYRKFVIEIKLAKIFTKTNRERSVQFVQDSLEVTCYDIPKDKINSLTITQRVINSEDSEELVERNTLQPRYASDEWFFHPDQSQTIVRLEKHNLAMQPAFTITCELTDCENGEHCRADSKVIHIRSKYIHFFACKC